MRLSSNSVLTVTVAFLSFDFAVGNLVFGSVGTPSPDGGFTCDVNQWADNRDKFSCGGPNGAVEVSCIATQNCCWDATAEPNCYAAHQKEDTTTASPEESTEGQSTAPANIETTSPGEDSTTAQSTDSTSSSEDTTTPLPEESTEGQSTTSADLETTSPGEESTTAQTTGSSSSSEDTTTPSPEESTEGQSTTPADLETTTPIQNSTTTPKTTGSSGSGTTESSTSQCYDSFSAAFSTENNCVYYSSGIIAGAVLSISLIWILIWYCACRTPVTMDEN